MIKKSGKFIIGFLAGALIIYALIYAFGTVLNEFEIVLYDSEDDQQKNFNIAIVIWLTGSVLSGYISTKY